MMRVKKSNEDDKKFEDYTIRFTDDDRLPKLFELAGRIQGLAQIAKEKSNTEQYIIQRLIKLGKESKSILGEK